MNRILSAAGALALLGCSTAANRRPLEEQLSKQREKDKAETPAEVARLEDRYAKELQTSGILGRIRKAGDTAPDFALPDPQGNEVSLKNLLRTGPVVLACYRGHW